MEIKISNLLNSDTYINNREVYIMSTIDGKGCHIGRITGVSLDANDGIVIETDIDSVSATE